MYDDHDLLPRLAEEIARLVMRLSEQTRRHFDAAAAGLGLTPAMAHALRNLNAEQPISMRMLAARMGTDPANVTGLVDRLQARGLADRQSDPQDRRIKRLVVTPAGLAVKQQMHKALMADAPAARNLADDDLVIFRNLLIRVLGGSAEV